MSKELVEIVRCKDCAHRPIEGDEYHCTLPPVDEYGSNDYMCPYLNPDDDWYSGCPDDDWFCADGELKGEESEREI